MGWSEECLGKLSQARVYLKNGGTLTREDFKGKDEKLNGKEKYREYAQRMMKEADEGCFDWSIFEKPIVPMDKASGTQILIESLGESRNILYCKKTLEFVNKKLHNNLTRPRFINNLISS